MRVSTVKCESCQEAFGKYRCPRCKLVSCSLSCVKQHKEAKNCNGVRDRAAFVPLKDFDDLQFLSDYRLLEDLQRVVEAGNGTQKFKVLKRLKVLRKQNPRPQYQHQNQRQPRRRRKNKFHNKKHCDPNLRNTIQENPCEKNKFVPPTEESKGESSTVCPSLKPDLHIHWDENEDVPPTEISLKSN